MDDESEYRAPAVPFDCFDTASLPEPKRFAVWRETVLPLFESFPAQDLRVHGFRAWLQSFNLNQMFFVRAAFSAQYFQRVLHHKARFGADCFLLQLWISGGCTGRNGQRELVVHPGDISFLDLERTLEAQADESEVLSLIIPRDLIASWLRPEGLDGGGVLRGDSPAGKILQSQMTTAWESLHDASLSDLESINQLLLGTALGAFRGDGQPHRTEAEQAQTLLEEICAYIQGNLGASDLGPEQLCRRFACSRARLYRLFAPIGGVARYIRDARLARCLDELTGTRGGRQQIIHVATRWGFASHSHFSRAFRQVYGFAPSEAASRAAAGTSVTNSAPERPDSRAKPALYHWLREL